MKCPKCDLKVKERFCLKCGYEVSANYECKKELGDGVRWGCFSLILLAIIFLIIALSVFAYVAGFVLCIMGGIPSCFDSPLFWLTLIDERIRIEGTVGWIEWILNTFFGFDD